MSEPAPPHPFLAPFWHRTGVRHSKTDSLTLNDFTYTLRLEDDAVELQEQEISYYDSSVVATRTLKGRWSPVRLDPEKAVLRISGEDGTERILVLLPDDVLTGDVEWGLRTHGGRP
jgi:hypothetical protein